ncbi:MAG: DUF4097 family beta strand repeat-containing protein [Nevskia sp.]|nr:DUF4097 family beta strand repeat-containing protein [Nevskia sp.]
MRQPGIVRGLGPALFAALLAAWPGRILAAGPDSGGGSDTQINERRPLNANGRVSVNEVSGTVVIGVWDRNEIAITGMLGSGVDHLEISGDADNLSVAVKLPKFVHRGGEADLRLMVPTTAGIAVETVSADVSVQGSRGAVKVQTVSGDVGLEAESPEVSVQTVSGDLIMHVPARSTQVNTVSGDLRLSGLQGKAAVETVSGNLQISGGKFSELRLKSISGDVRVDASFADTATVVGESLSGDITLHLPADASGTAALKSFSGEAQCDAQQTEASSSPGNKRREYRFGDGKGLKLELSTFSGDIRVDRKQGAEAAK